MQTFPAQYSTLSATALNDYIAETYGLTGLHCKLLLHGVSDTYVLKRDGMPAYIFKVYRDSHRGTHGILGELELLNILHANNVSVAYPITDLKGVQLQLFNAVEGPRYGVLTHYAPGKNVYDLTDGHLKTLGREVGRFHTISRATTLQYERETYDLQRLLMAPLETIAPAFEEYPEGYAYLQETADKVLKKINALPVHTFSVGYCHYDLLPKNYFFDGEDKVTLFDFDFLGKGWLANDITSFFMHFFFHVARQKISQEEANRCFAVFLEAYRQEFPFSKAEEAVVPYLGVVFWIFYLGYQYEHRDDWSNYFFNTGYLRERVDVIRKYAGWYCEL